MKKITLMALLLGTLVSCRKNENTSPLQSVSTQAVNPKAQAKDNDKVQVDTYTGIYYYSKQADAGTCAGATQECIMVTITSSSMTKSVSQDGNTITYSSTDGTTFPVTGFDGQGNKLQPELVTGMSINKASSTSLSFAFKR